MPFWLFAVASTLGRLPGTWVLSAEGATTAGGHYVEMALVMGIVAALGVPLYAAPGIASWPDIAVARLPPRRAGDDVAASGYGREGIDPSTYGSRIPTPLPEPTVEPARLAAMRANAASLARPNAARDIATTLIG